MAALMKQGLAVWDGASEKEFISDIDLAFVTADTPGMTLMSGLVGNSGHYVCCLYCPM